ncbi:MAG: endonuclease III [Candidatus Diapherotrites archaeon]|nr:endonuclease III [Candidatus Diapherotrites archaeon]
MKEKINRIIRIIEKQIGKTKPVVSFSSKYKTIITTVLSARTKDETTFKVSKKLFSKYKSFRELAKAKTEDIEKQIYPVGFYKTKAKNIKKLAEIIVKKYNSKVPSNFKELITLPGVGRKTANIVLSLCFKKPTIAVDTHVHRISNRIGVVKTKKPEQTEKELKNKIDKKHWIKINELFVKFGQRICKPLRPNCKICKIKKYCNFYLNDLKADANS